MKATGGGAYKFADLFKERLGISIEKEDEMNCLVSGANFLLKVRSKFLCLIYSVGKLSIWPEVATLLLYLPYIMILMSYLLHYDLILINGKWLIYVLSSLTYVLVRSICCELNASGISVFVFNFFFFFFWDFEDCNCHCLFVYVKLKCELKFYGVYITKHKI